jgi:hypothetical protein
MACRRGKDEGERMKDELKPICASIHPSFRPESARGKSQISSTKSQTSSKPEKEENSKTTSRAVLEFSSFSSSEFV